jgi:hypothetical protein
MFAAEEFEGGAATTGSPTSAGEKGNVLYYNVRYPNLDAIGKISFDVFDVFIDVQSRSMYSPISLSIESNSSSRAASSPACSAKCMFVEFVCSDLLCSAAELSVSLK